MSDKQYFSFDPQVPTHAKTARQHVAQLRVASRDLLIGTDRGVFSRKGIDPGTLVLIESAGRPPQQGNFLDLGCGTGPIALTLATYSPAATVYAIDVNPRAVELTADNARLNKVNNIIACGNTEVPDDVMFDVIWSNPPIRIGKQELHQLLSLWLVRLSSHGEAWLVINRNLGSDSLAMWLIEQGYSCERLTSKRGYRVLRVKPKHAQDQPESSV